MQKTLTDLEALQLAITHKWQEYREAIVANKRFSEVKSIYVEIKELEKQADLLMQRAQILRFGDTSFINDGGFMIQ